VEVENQSKYASERLVTHFACVHGCILGSQMKALMFIGMPTIQGESSDKAQLAIRPLILAVVKVLEAMAFEVAMLFGVIEKIPTEQETLTLSEQEKLGFDITLVQQAREGSIEMKFIFWGEWICWMSNCCSRCRSSLQQRGQLSDDDEINSFLFCLFYFIMS